MKIAVNARFLTKPFTGIGQYTFNILKNLAEIDKENEYLALVPAGVSFRFKGNIKIVVLPERKVGSAGMRKTWWEQVQVPNFMKKEKAETAWFTYPSNPWSRDFYRGIKTMVTIHDAIPWLSSTYRRGVLRKLYYAQTKKAAKKADIVLTVSEVSKKDIAKACEVHPKKIKVVYNDASSEYKEKSSSHMRASLLKKFGLQEGKYFLYVGGYDERKNVRTLISEFEIFEAKNKEIKLVLAGGKQQQNSLYESFEKASGENIVKTGFLSNKELKYLYDGALAFVNISKMEGFNIPLIEAANARIPLIVSDIPVHKEVAGENAIYANYEKKGEVAEKMEKVLETSFRAKYAKKALELAKKYDFRKAAEEIKELF